jgi:hypothetical protein
MQPSVVPGLLESCLGEPCLGKPRPGTVPRHVSSVHVPGTVPKPCLEGTWLEDGCSRAG